MTIFRSALVALALSMAAGASMAADATGVWKGDVKLPTGQLLPFAARLQQQGATVTGKMDGIAGAPDVVIAEGRVENDVVTFSGTRQINNAPVKFNYIATFLDADTLEFKILREGAAPLGTVTKRTRE